MSVRATAILVIWLASASGVAHVSAQETTQPAAPSDGDLLDQMLRPSGSGAPAPLQPVPPPTPPPMPGATPPPAPTTQPLNLLREGTYVVNRTGRLVKTVDGSRYEFTLDPLPGQTAPDFSAGVLPNLQLMAMENAQRDVNRELHFNVTGVVTEYNGKNYILLETSSQPTSLEEALAARSVAAAAAAAGASPLPPPPPPPTTQPKLVPATELLEQMLRDGSKSPKRLQPSGDPAQRDKTTGAAAVAPGAEQMNVMREGTFVLDRTGRLTKSADGSQSEFTFDSDGRSMRDPPIVVLPNLKLKAMEDAVNGSNRDLRFRVTGVVTEYRGRNYVLLEKAVVVPEVVQQF
jgi:hypothetical protein